jgi:heme-degrading monooxygenase HmoA
MSHDAEYAQMAERMDLLVRQQPGFIEMTSVRDPSTRWGVTVATFEDEDAARAWKGHPEHLEAQRRGIEDFYEEYRVVVAEVSRHYGYRR